MKFRFIEVGQVEVEIELMPQRLQKPDVGFEARFAHGACAGRQNH